MLSQEQLEQLILARYYYAYGVDYMSDTLYEEGMNILRTESPNHILLQRHWSEDPLPMQLLMKYNLPYVDNKQSEYLEELELPSEILELQKEYLNNYSSRYNDSSQKSIELIQDYDTIFNRVEEIGRGTLLHASIKADGQNYTAVYFRGHLVLAKTKGRTGNPMDITKVMRIVLPKYLELDEEVVILSGELVCYKHSLPYLRENYKQAFKSTRSAVSSLLRGGLSEEDIHQHLRPLVFKVRSEHLHTLEEEFRWAKDRGFNVPAFITFTYNSWEDMIELFNYFSPFKEQLPYSSDGLVLAINDNETFYAQGETSHHYLGNLALKVGVWNPGYYVGIVTDIKWSWGEETVSPEAVIEPVLVSHGAHVTSIPLNHVGRMVEHNIVPGSEIYFKVTGDSKITLVHKEEELQNIKI